MADGGHGGDATAAEAAADRVVGQLERARRFLAGGMLVAVMVGQGAVDSYRVAGASMVPAFLDGDRIVVAALPGFFGEPRCGEAVIARVGDEIVIKRVAGLPGERIELGDGWLRRDGRPSDDAVPPEYHDHCRYGPLVLGPDEFFLLGDHRDVSVDSREFGPVPRSHLLGRVILKVPAEPAREPVAARARR